jgi:hypothetical protein
MRDITLAPISVETGFQLNVLLPPHRGRAPRGWNRLIGELEHGQVPTHAGALRLWVRSPHLAQLENILENAKQCPSWGHEVTQHLIFRYVLRTEYYALNEEFVDLPLNESMGFVPTPELIEEVNQARDRAWALDDAAFQRKRQTGKPPTSEEIEHYKLHGEWPEALP